MDTTEPSGSVELASAVDAHRIKYLYHRAWEFIGVPERLPSGLFQAAVHYRSLLTGRVGMLEVDTRPCKTASLALALGWEGATKWAREQRDDHHGRL